MRDTRHWHVTAFLQRFTDRRIECRTFDIGRRDDKHLLACLYTAHIRLGNGSEAVLSLFDLCDPSLGDQEIDC